MTKAWIPSQLERKCLQHLDAPNSWDVLKTERPEETEILPWRPFRRIFAFNFVLFALVLAGLFFVLETTSGTEPADIRTDLPYGLGFAATFAVLLGVYVTYLYRRSWNGRARFLTRQDD